MLRGIAIVLMVIYHFCFDLTYFGIARFDFYHDAFWLNFRTLIVSLFLGLVGVSLALAARQQFNRAAYLRRLAQIGGCALLVTLSTWWLFPKSYTFFGVLHFIALASVLALPLTRFFFANLFLGISLVVLGVTLQHAFFDGPWWRWVGLMTHKPVTQDYVPLLPWLGVVLIGLFLGKWLPQSKQFSALFGGAAQAAVPRGLAWGGRHALLIYMLHQPLLMGGLYLFL